MPAAGGDSRTEPSGTAVAVQRALTQSLGKLSLFSLGPLPAQLAGLHPREIHTQTTRERSSDVHGSLVGDGGIPRPLRNGGGNKRDRKKACREGWAASGAAGRMHPQQHRGVLRT